MEKKLAILACMLFIQPALAGSFDDAVKIQRNAESEKFDSERVSAEVEKRKKEMNLILQSLFFQYYKGVKTSGLKLVNPQTNIDEINSARQRSRYCCDIVVAERYDNGMYVTNRDGDGLFVIDGYGLQSVDGVIVDESFEETGKISKQCKYEVSISYENSRTYDCGLFRSRKIDAKVVRDMKEMLPKAMKDYH